MNTHQKDMKDQTEFCDQLQRFQTIIREDLSLESNQFGQSGSTQNDTGENFTNDTGLFEIRDGGLFFWVLSSATKVVCWVSI
jgi:hypothetical protein